MLTELQRKAILIKFLYEEDKEKIHMVDITYSTGSKDCTLGNREYRVLTDEEAEEEAGEYIKETLWAFNLEFINRHISNDVDIFEDEYTTRSFRKVQELCESANPAFEALIGDNLNTFIADAIKEDGRGHFISLYDGNEHEINHDGITYFVYRTN